MKTTYDKLIFPDRDNPSASVKCTKKRGYGWDTETYLGECKLLCRSDGKYLFMPTFEEALIFMSDKNSREHHNLWWNMAYDIDGILKLCDSTELVKQILSGEETEITSKLSVRYLNRRLLTIIRGKNNTYHTDLFRFVPRKLEKVANKFLNTGKLKDTDASLLNTQLWYWIRNMDAIIDYCIRDAKLVEQIFEAISEAAYEIGIFPKLFISPASLSKYYFTQRAPVLTYHYFPEQINKIAYEAYFGGRFEVLERGFVGRVYLYDIVSAYPYLISKLPDFRRGIWSHYDPNLDRKWGFYRILLEMSETERVAPLPARLQGGLVIYPTGLRTGWITTLEYQAMKDKPEVLEAWTWHSNHEKPVYRNAMKKLWLVKKRSKKDSPLREVAKLSLNSFYGAKIEVNGSPENGWQVGRFFSPVEACFITAGTRAMLLEATNGQEKDILAFHTDSIMSKKPLTNISLGKELGQWEKEAEGNAVILGCGMYSVSNYKDKQRGFSTDLDLFRYIRDHPNDKEVSIVSLQRYSSTVAVKRFQDHKYANVLTPEEKVLNLNSDQKRVWSDRFESVSDLLTHRHTSSPYHFFVSGSNVVLHSDIE